MDRPRIAEDVGRRVREARRARGWSIRVAAQRLGVSVRFLNELERGKPTARLDKMSRVLGGLGLTLQVAAQAFKSGAREGVFAQQRLLRAIAIARGVRRMFLFGSTARDEAGPGSDLDFLVELEDGRSLLDLVGVKHDLEALCQRRVDVFTRRSLKPQVLASAQRDLVRVL
jgi:hypothetical protein